MARSAARFVALLFLSLPLSGLDAVPPRPAPRIYATANYMLTFGTPPHTTYCPLPAHWVGSDHGTTLFLQRPRDCDGAGYPSSDRGFTPTDTARIEIYYAYSTADDRPSPPPCREAGRLVLLGAERPLCRTDQDGMIVLTAAAPYPASSDAEAVLTLRSRPARLAADLATFRGLAATLQTCTARLREGRGFHSYGRGLPCPRARWF
jgi:hypothetical protein